MMRTFWFFILCWLIPVAAWSQVLPVRSGAHDGFTRLVIDLPETVEWKLEEGVQARTFRLTFPGRSFSFDTDAVFQRIGTDRLSAIRNAPQEGSLELSLSCTCDINAFLVDDSMLVLDISEKVALPDPPKIVGDVVDFTTVRLNGVPSLGPRARPKMANGRLEMPSSASKPSESSEDINLKQNLARQISTAATIGILTPKDSSTSTTVEPLLKNDAVNKSDDLKLSQFDLAQDKDASKTSLTTVTKMMVSRQRIKLNAQNCIPDEQLDIEDWAASENFSDQIGTYRRQLFKEFDAPNQTAAENLTRLYLHYGFGDEARAILALLSGTDRRRTKESLAYILDSRKDPATTFAGQLHCDSSVSLWSALAVPTDGGSEYVNTSAILRSFEKLPTHLKKLLAARLSSALLALGEPAAADSVLSRTRRSIEEPNSDIALAEVRNNTSWDLTDDVLYDLATLARSSDRAVSSTALESAINLAVKEDKPVPPDLVDLASAYATEYRGTDEAAKLWRAHLRGLLRNGEIKAALAEIEYARDIEATERAAMKNEAFQSLVERASDVQFLTHALTDLRASSIEVAQETLMAAAERFLAIGLLHEALWTLDQSSGDGNERDVRALRARIYLALSRPEDAEIALIGLQGDDVQALRVQARMQMGDFEYVRSAYDALGQTADADRAAWILGDWERVAQSASDTLVSVAELVQSSEPTNGDANALSLAQSETVLNQSEAARATLRTLLEDTRISASSEN